MNVGDVAVVAGDLAAAAGLGWWFFGPKPTAEAVVAGGVQEVRVTVRGGYSPSRIRVKAGLPVRLVFDRRESGDCTSRVVLPDLGVSADLPAFGQAAVEFTPADAGEYGLSCGMNMAQGVLVVEDGPGGRVRPAPLGGNSRGLPLGKRWPPRSRPRGPVRAAPAGPGPARARPRWWCRRS